MAFKKSELLAPAGSIESLKAAVYAGADAVYFGGGNFNARAFAKNFTKDELNQAFYICRTFGVKAYIVLNTVLTDKEIPEVLDFVSELEELYKPDAYIVQDIGLISVLKKCFPDIPLHASTQMQLHSSAAALSAKELGLERIVFARELSKKNIKAVAECGLQCEIFAHGAVCVCQSGGCLMSSFIGGRSGNRGKCAQPCRQMYNGKYPLSLKDMCYASHIPEICEMGVDCIKIEGRMKSPEYVFEVVSVYRKLLDECRVPTKSELKRLSDVFSRSGLSDGYFTDKKNAGMFGTRTEQDKEQSRLLDTKIAEKRLGVKIYASFRLEEKSYISVCCGDYSAEVYGEEPVCAVNRPINSESLTERLSKTGGTVFVVDECKVDVDDGIILPVSSVNSLRREALNKLNDVIIKNNTPNRCVVKRTFSVEEDVKSSIVPKLIARFEAKLPSKMVLKEAYSVCDRVDLPLWVNLPDYIDVSKTSLVLPRVVFDSDTDEIVRLLEIAKNKGITQLTVTNIGMLHLCKGFVIHGDYTLNVTNIPCAKRLTELGFSSLTISPELIPRQISKKIENTEYIVYGKAPLMHTETCIISNVQACNKQSYCSTTLNDKTGASFYVMREYNHRNTIYNSVPTYLIDKQKQLENVDGHILFFTDENETEMLNVIGCYKSSAPPTGAFTRAAFRKTKEVF